MQRKRPKTLLHDLINERVHIARAKLTHVLNVDGSYFECFVSLNDFSANWFVQGDAANFESASSMFQIVFFLWTKIICIIITYKQD